MPTLYEFKDMVRSGDYVVLDTETTGLRDAEIVQIAIIDSNAQVLMNTLIKPVRPIPGDAIRIHGITNEMVADKPGMLFYYHQIKEMIANRNVIVFNVAYDKQILYDSLQIANIETIEWETHSKWWCAMEAFSEVKGEWNSKRKSYKWQSLSKACDYYNLPVANAHNALGDCLLTIQVCKKMIETNQQSSYMEKAASVKSEVVSTNQVQKPEPPSSLPSSSPSPSPVYRSMYEDWN